MNTSCVYIKAPAILHIKDADFAWVRFQSWQRRLLADPCQIPSALTCERESPKEIWEASLYYPYITLPQSGLQRQRNVVRWKAWFGVPRIRTIPP